MTVQTGTALFDATRWRRLRELTDRLDTLDADARARALDRIAAEDAELARQASALLAADADKAVDELSNAVQRTMRPAHAMPEHVGPFQLLRPLGAGGMGVVYLGERATPEFVQRVALKILDGDAMRVSTLVARERRVLAALNHPNITAFVDAGHDAGCAWLAMEYVDGEPLLTWCARNSLGTRERVHLFGQICAAVAHAHGQLVVHRDLKPANVLVNAEGTVKLLDFGIALILDPTTLDPAAAQAPATRVFTPEYAAPEQLRGERATPATDIHALGLMLFELVAGKRLPTLERATPREEWNTTQLARAASEAKTSVVSVTQHLRGDLGRIIAHALAPDPARRYASALHFRDDLRRWMEYRPLSIAKPSVRYVAARFVRRNRAVVAVATLAVIGLLATTGYALWQAEQATRMAARAEHGKDFLAALLTDANPFNAKDGGKSNIKLLENAAARLEREFSDAPEHQVALRQTIASALSRLGEPKLALQLQQRNVAQIRQLHGEHSPQLGVALSGLAQTSEDSGDIDHARALFEQAYAILQGAGDAYRKQRMTAMTGLGKMANRRSDFAQGEKWYTQVLRERVAQEGPESADIAMDWFNLASCAIYQERFAQARERAQRAHDMLARIFGANHPRFIYVDLGLGIAQAKSGQIAASIETLDHALSLASAHLKPNAEIIATIQNGLSASHYYAGDYAAAKTSAQSAISIFAAMHSPALGVGELNLGRAQLRTGDRQALNSLAASREHLQADITRVAGNARFLALAQAAHGAAFARFGDAVQGETQARAARAQLLETYPAGGEKLGEIDSYLADILDARGNRLEARKARMEALDTFRRLYGEEHPVTQALAKQLAEN